MKLDKKLLAKCIAIPLLIGTAASLITMGGMKAFEALNQPPLSPPMWLFPVAWTILYVLMGVASYLVYTSGADQKQVRDAIGVYAAQLLVNFLWPIFFFHFQYTFIGLYLRAGAPTGFKFISSCCNAVFLISIIRTNWAKSFRDSSI